jgi:dihydrofolate reductase
LINGSVEYGTGASGESDEGGNVGRIVVTEFISIDGVVDDPGGAEGFKHGGWALEISRGDEGDKFKADETFEAEAQLLGRRTYEEFAKAWPSREGEFADRFNSMPKFVVSSTLSDPEWTNSTVVSDLDEVRKLRENTDGILLVAGSIQLVQSLIDQDLVDELRLMVFPVVLGAGRRLFGETGDKKLFELADSKAVGDGVSILIYEPAS